MLPILLAFRLVSGVFWIQGSVCKGYGDTAGSVVKEAGNRRVRCSQHQFAIPWTWSERLTKVMEEAFLNCCAGGDGEDHAVHNFLRYRLTTRGLPVSMVLSAVLVPECT